ncbi:MULTISPECIES: NACHT domain-containing protein [unclassified Amycolatopsis]|uniref:NACHT domain-containing protein n=1 Tax=unclassified Amycolatopsis TaxID=2618356 RepID=UPI002875606A|nr:MULTISPECIES: NACHT domain-containing protein [unclassified Amycolatopsis]MDS0138547.1 NACHT domain-containing protein [Amycolatopsis sp. 505]MDS0146176.1 NACHT domain-containing protein [Amycolatopsis sp. CM201R]
MIPYASGLIVTVAGLVYQRRKYLKSLTRDLGLETFPQYVLRGVGSRITRHLRPRIAARLSLRDFALNRLAASQNRLPVPAAIPVELVLDDMFVPLTATASDRSRMSATKIVQGEYRRILLVGDPGSGKSTLVKRIYRDICRRAITVGDVRTSHIPVFIELKSLGSTGKTASTGSLITLVETEVTSVNTYASKDLFDSFVDAGRITVLLDGLDEINTSEFASLSAEITNLCDHLAKKHLANRVIVTTRRQLYVNLPADFTEAFDAHLTLEPFTADDMYEFLRKWPYRSEPDQNLARIFGNLSAQPNIRSMCETPLILAMYVATDQVTGGGDSLPETRPDFYRAVVDELLVRRRSRQLGLTTGLNVLRRTRQHLLGKVALEHLLDGNQSRNALDWGKAISIFQEEEGLSELEAGERIRELSRDTGLFTEERPEETLRFGHLTFCEFLAADAVDRGDGRTWRRITRAIEQTGDEERGHRFGERLAEVIVFSLALQKNDRVRQERLLWASRSGSIELGLRAVIDSQPYDDETVMSELDRIADLVSAQENRDDNWFHLFRLVAIALRDRELAESSITGHRPSYLKPFFVKATADAKVGFDPLFLSYMRLDPGAAVELARSIGIEMAADRPDLLVKVLDEPAVLAHAIARFQETKEDMRRWAPILAIGACYHPSVRTRLQSISPNLASAHDWIPPDRGRRTCWYQDFGLEDSILGVVLEAGCRWPGTSATLKFLQSVRPRRNRAIDFAKKATSLTTLVALMTISIADYFAIKTVYPSYGLTISLSILLATTVSFASIFNLFWRRFLVFKVRQFGHLSGKSHLSTPRLSFFSTIELIYRHPHSSTYSLINPPPAEMIHGSRVNLLHHLTNPALLTLSPSSRFFIADILLSTLARREIDADTIELPDGETQIIE